MGHPIQIILARQLAGYLSVPVFLVDQTGNLLFYNEPAEVILGQRFDETGAMPDLSAFGDGAGRPAKRDLSRLDCDQPLARLAYLD